MRYVAVSFVLWSVVAVGSAGAFGFVRPVAIEGTLQVGWAFGEIGSIGSYTMLGFCGPLHGAVRAASGLEVELTGVFRAPTTLDVTRVRLRGSVEGGASLSGVVAQGEDGTLSVGESTVRPEGPLAKALRACHGVSVTVEGEDSGDGGLQVSSIEVPFPKDFPWGGR